MRKDEALRRGEVEVGGGQNEESDLLDFVLEVVFTSHSEAGRLLFLCLERVYVI